MSRDYDRRPVPDRRDRRDPDPPRRDPEPPPRTLDPPRRDSAPPRRDPPPRTPPPARTEPSDRARVERALQPGEQIAWVGRPKTLLLGSGSGATLFFGVLWSSVSGVVCGTFLRNLWFSDGSAKVMVNGRATTFGAMSGAERFFLTAFCLVFLGIGLVMLLSPFWRRAIASRTVYAVTDRRALRIRPFGVLSEDASSIRVHGVCRRERRKGRVADLFYTIRIVQGKHGSHRVSDGFTDLSPRDAAEAEAALRALLGPAGPSPSLSSRPSPSTPPPLLPRRPPSTPPPLLPRRPPRLPH